MRKRLKNLFTEKVIVSCLDKKQGPIRVLDVGCGAGEYVKEFLERTPSVTYVGIEPIHESYEKAVKNIGNLPNVKLYKGLAYGALDGEVDGSFDLIVSQSVLEHVKHLKRFLEFSAQYLAVGGMVMHRYDLGHAFYPHTWWAKLHVWLGNTTPWVLPERQFVRYVPLDEVTHLYRSLGIEPYKVTYHQMVGHKEIEKISDTANRVDAAVEALFEWEEVFQDVIQLLPETKREKLFPSIAVWGLKK